MRLPGVFTRNLRLKLLAGGLAVLTWGTVVYAGNPPDTRTMSLHVPQDPGSLPPQFVLLRPVDDIQVRVVGTRDHLAALDPRDLSVHVAYDRVRRAGDQQVPITISNRDPDVEIDSAPTSVLMALDDLGSTANRSTSSSAPRFPAATSARWPPPHRPR